MRWVGIGLLVMAYVLAVLDVVREDTSLYLSDGGPRGWRVTWAEHRWLVFGGVSGVAGTMISALAPA